MPTVLRADGFSVMIYTHDSRPAHVHVFKGAAELIVSVPADGPVSVRMNYRMRATDAIAAVRLVELNLGDLRKRWRKLHGKD